MNLNFTIIHCVNASNIDLFSSPLSYINKTNKIANITNIDEQDPTMFNGYVYRCSMDFDADCI